VYWGGGSVFTATSALRWHLPQQAPAGLEDGTLPFLEILSLVNGLKVSKWFI
jgi:selenocysteine lyase/cysteine desulfurase